MLAFVPPLLIPLLSPAVGEAYGVGDALAHGACLFVGGSAFFGLAFLLSTVFTDLWRPLLAACAVAVVLATVGQAFRDVSRYGVFGVMSGEVYFRTGALPWLGLLVGFPAYRWFFAISLGIGVVVALILFLWHRLRPVRAEDVEDKRPLKLD